MMHYFQTLFRRLVSSIAFLPALISLAFFFCALLIVYLNAMDYQAQAGESLQVLLVKGNDNARQVLSAIIGGIISLTVFSFSSVLLLLNQASANFTPRILPTLLTDKKHQFVLGYYIGTIVYCIILILNIQPGELTHSSPKFGVLLAMIFGISCMGLFMYFIHLISLKLQVSQIIVLAAQQSVRLIRKMHKKEKPDSTPLPEGITWQLFRSQESGYLSQINTHRLQQLCHKYQFQIEVTVVIGTFIVKNSPLLKIGQQRPTTPKLYTAIIDCFSFGLEPYREGSYLYGINQISEIAVKSLSPGINDPGTALMAIDYLSIIFNYLLKPGEISLQEDSPKTDWLICKAHSLSELLFAYILPIHHYGRSDAKVHRKLLEFYSRLFPLLIRTADKELIKKLVAEQWESIRKNIASPSQIVFLSENTEMNFA